MAQDIVVPGNTVLAEIVIKMVQSPDGGVSFECSHPNDPVMAYGMLEIAKDVVRASIARSSTSGAHPQLAIARGAIPRRM